MRACLPLLCAVLLLCSQAWCQSPPVQWSRFYGNAAGAGAMKTIQTPDGGYLIAAQVFAGGGMVSNHHGGEDIWLVKVDAAGDIQWERCFGGSAADRLSQLGHGGDIMVTNDGGYMLVGHSRSTDGDVTAAIEGNHGGWDAWVVKLSAAGNIQWQRSMGGSNDDFDFSVKQLADDSYVLAGHTLSNDHNVSGNHGMADTWVVKLNSAGTVIQWQKCLGSSEYELNAKLDLTSDGGIVVMS
ncbi:MAG TPA: hypothetical protein VD996_16715, partial [Chitinophagaceae bacterium]|nr:hypothetical protein [Chitinophagaceae bacterium]